MQSLYWLPEAQNFRDRLRLLTAHPSDACEEAIRLAELRLDFIQTNALDQTMRRAASGSSSRSFVTDTVRLAILGSCNMTHLHGAIRVAGLRRRIPIEIYECQYGQAWQELANSDSELHRFKPTHVLTALDAHHLTGPLGTLNKSSDPGAELAGAEDHVRKLWRLAKQMLAVPIMHQTPIQLHPPLLGANEHRWQCSPAAFVAQISRDLRVMADAEAVNLLALDDVVMRDGLDVWHSPSLWHRAKHEISLSSAPQYGDLVARLLAAQLGRSSKCLVLDLDNTLWGGVIGDDGLEGIVLGQGSGLGEAFLAFQSYVRALSDRGIILAVCSKNDEANALQVFDEHPEMVLRRRDIACFVANWSDKATNIRAIAGSLNIGIDSLVFVDDNPFERELVRRELPMVAVPEIGDDPTHYARTLADAGYFEAVHVTDVDRVRSEQYQTDSQRADLRKSSTDLNSYLEDLHMELLWRPFDRVSLARNVQLINKTNQFNLTTKRYTEDEILSVMSDNQSMTLQLRLVDRFGDSGIIAIVIGRLEGSDLLIDTWLMSCRVLGRCIENATLNIIIGQAVGMGARRLIGQYIATGRNEMVREHYKKLGFVEPAGSSDDARSVLDLSEVAPSSQMFIVIRGI